MSKAASSFRMAVGLAVLAAMAVGPASARNSNGMEAGGTTITLRVYDYARLNRPVLLAAESEAGEILAQAGIATTWLDCPVSHDEVSNYPGCPSEWQAYDFAVSLLPNTMVDSRAKWQEALGSTPECESIASCTANIFHGRVLKMAEGASATLPVLLGRALAHEIGHLLLGAHSHSRTGIMRASWSGQDLRLNGRPYLLFTSAQSREMKSRLAERVQAWQAQARAADLGRR